jgi:GDP-4-dehydro-6-deoxy-D-mannose reductase
MKALITGINGFAGSYLAENLLKKNWEVDGIVQPKTDISNIELIQDKISIFYSDLNDRSALENAVRESSPDVFFHLAGASSVKESFADPVKYFQVNVIGSLNLLEAIKMHNPTATVLVVTSAEIYGESLLNEKIVNEDSLILPKSPYAASKASLDILARSYLYSSDIKIVIARPSSHIGPRQSDVFFVPTLVRQVAEIYKGSKLPEIYLGNLNAYRDFTDVKDVVDAYALLAIKGERGKAYNICSGEKHLLRDIVDNIIKLSGKEITVNTNTENLRRTDILDMKIDNSRIVREIGWLPKINIDQSLKETFNYWLTKV